MKITYISETGPCWFCGEKDNTLAFDPEFDTYVHVECIRKALEINPKDPEANFMKYLLDNNQSQTPDTEMPDDGNCPF